MTESSRTSALSLTRSIRLIGLDARNGLAVGALARMYDSVELRTTTYVKMDTPKTPMHVQNRSFVLGGGSRANINFNFACIPVFVVEGRIAASWWRATQYAFAIMQKPGAVFRSVEAPKRKRFDAGCIAM